ncbi:MAG: M24 family metallopeptidase [Gluconacetobacter sp.]|uniref:Aminopeptidase P family protein n=1 Tax=Gluconacetobacter dulcium TaxID=2729096 RepID=A0A7W4PIF6_9PROT|nr:M24 family metallopeptidase [Gluconacetobacter dulcium]MBB2195896.1 aminopeptidase P family protein [Gluconacetobacter dulcium]
MISAAANDTGRYEQAQAAARGALEAIVPFLQPGQSEASLMEVCGRLMNERGATGYWWYGVPALILAGPRLKESMEGDCYVPSSRPIGPDEMITIDVAPEIDGCWGDCARSFFLRDGQVVSPEEAGPDAAAGIAAEHALHARLMQIAAPSMTFRELYLAMDAMVLDFGFRNLDFLSNYGHSIGGDVMARTFLDASCRARLDSVPMFTFEPHIARPEGSLAFKHEEIYLFRNGRLQTL